MIDFIEKNVHGAWVIHGVIGYRQYYFYAKADAETLYKEEVKKTYLPFINQPVRRSVQ